MLTWDELVGICETQLTNVPPQVFERTLKDLAEPDFARQTECIDGEKLYATVAATNNYEMPMGVIRIKSLEYKGKTLDATKVENLKSGEQYQTGDGTTLRTGTPTKYYTHNDRLYLLPCPTEAVALRMRYSQLPTYATRKFIALDGTTTTLIYLDIGIEELADDGVTFTNDTRTLTGVCSAYSNAGNRHKYTVAAMAAQTAGDIITLDLTPYAPTIPEIHVHRLIPYALAMGYSHREDDRMYQQKMAEYYALANEVKGERHMRGYPDGVVHDNVVIR